MDEVIKSINENEQELAIAKRQRTVAIVKWSLIITGIVLVVAAIVIFGIIVWRN